MSDKKVAQKFYCSCCDYSSCKKYNYDKHLLTRKHKFATNDDNVTKSSFECICGKTYKHRQGFYHHKKKCKVANNVAKSSNLLISHDNSFENNKKILENDNKLDKLDKLIDLLVQSQINNNEQQNNILEKICEKQSEQHQKILTEIIPKIGNTTNNNNNQFNINMFLNEKCKDAINIKEFIDMIVFNKDPMDDSKNLGIEKTMTNLIIDKLNSLDIHKRPIHCSDIRRETIYVKDNGEWTKTNTKTILKKMIRSIQDKGCTTLSEWRKENPDDPKGNPDLLDPNALYYHKVIKQVCLETEKYDDKVIRNICKNTYVK